MHSFRAVAVAAHLRWLVSWAASQFLFQTISILLLLVVFAQNRFDDYYGLITSKLNLNSLPNRLPKIIVLKHCRSDAQGVQSSYYANGQDATQKCPASQM